jgi:integrase
MGVLKIDNRYSLNAVKLQSDYYRNLPSCNFVGFCQTYVNTYKRNNAKDRLTFLNTINHFSNFQGYMDLIYHSNEINKEVLDMFTTYLKTEKNFRLGTIKGILIRIKYMLKKCNLNGYSVDNSYQEANVKNEDSFKIYLDVPDIARIYYCDTLSKKQEELRDIFIVGCMTGLRYSDYSRLTKANVRDGNIYMKTQKTKTDVCIPMTKYVREIYEKYNNGFPPPRSIQYFNKWIKIVCKNAGLVEPISHEVEDKDGKIKTVTNLKYEIITSHTPRSSFITNMVKSKISDVQIMMFTGHRSTSSFVRYNRMTKEENARSLSGIGYLV